MPPASSAEDPNAQTQDAVASDATDPKDANPENSSDSDSKDVSAADPSPADDTDANRSEETLLDIVRNAVDAESKQRSSSGDSSDSESSQDGSSEGESKDEDGKGAGAEEDPDEQVPFHNHPRWKAVNAELKELRPLKQEIEGLKPKAEALDQMVGFAENASLSSDEVNQGFSVMAVMKNDPEKAIPILEGYLAQLRQVTGDTLPVDLQDQVDRGMITKEAAVEFSRTQSREARSTAAADSAKREADDIRQKRDLEIQGRDVVSAIEKWDETWKNSDPDYGMKTQRVKEKIELYIGRNGLPSTPKDAVDIAEEARKAVEKELKVLVPKKQSIDPDPSGSSGKATPVPQSPLEVVRAVVNG